jgi:hypothetical protein
MPALWVNPASDSALMHLQQPAATAVTISENPMMIIAIGNFQCELLH